MADFVAVIRRAVDGLSENTPEMRVKVYERARGAVQRQLENMKPRPPEQMLQRQLDKLEAAIREVESEHAEALPPLESEAEQEASAASEAHDAPYVEEPYAEQPPETADAYEAAPEERAEEQVAQAGEEQVAEAGGEPSRLEQLDAHEEAAGHEEPAAYEEPAADVPRDEPVVAYARADEQPEAVAPDDYREEPQWHPAEEGNESAEEYPAEEHHAADLQEHAAEQPVEAAEEVDEQPAAAEVRADNNVWDLPRKWPEQASEAPSYALDEETGRVAEPEAGEALSGREDEFVEHSRDEPLHSDGAGHFDPVWPKPASEAAAASESDWAVEELRRLSNTAPFDAQPANDDERSPPAAKMPAAKDAFIWDPNAFDAVPPPEAGAAKKSPFPAQFDDIDLFADVHGNGSTPKKEAPSNSRSREAEQLDAYLRDTDDTEGAPPDLDQLVASKLQGKSFRLEPKRRRFSIGRIVTIIVVLGILGGSGYAAWLNRDALNEMVAGLVSAARQGGVAGTQAPPQQTATQNPPAPATDNSNAQGNAANGQPKQQETAALDRNASDSTKFTQRLMPDGSEVDVGAAPIPGQPAAEGRSVAEQNVASTEAPPAASPAQPPAGNTPAAQAQAQAAQQTPTVGSAQKLFLYEERLGQSSPVAIEGTVVWSLQHEEGTGGRSEPTVQGNVSVPERNLSALITFKRNSDSSLPASHLVEIVFQLPQNFEGGGVDSVERISMKQTEQDRGDPLIAVPAKITDDFYMVALNDYADARKANMGLLQTRNWIDMPITYRNGRRALLTMEKGQTGGDAFNTAIKEWTALGDVTSSSQ